MRRMKHEKGTTRKSGRRISAWFHSAEAKCTLIITLGGLLIYLLVCLACAPDRYSLEVGKVSNYTINATKNVPDTYTERKEREAAAARVEATYHTVEGASESVMASLDSLFDQLREVQEYGSALLAADETIDLTDEMVLTHAKGMVTTITLTDSQATALLTTDAQMFNTMVFQVKSAVKSELDSTIREGQVSSSINNIKKLCKDKIDAKLTSSIVPAVLNACVTYNMDLDEEKTAEDRKAASDAVRVEEYLAGQNIIRSGDVVTQQQLEMLETLGLLDTGKRDFSVYGGAAMLVALALVMMVLMLRLLTPDVLRDIRSCAVIMIVLIISEGLCVLSVELINVYLAPVALGAMLLTGLINPRVGLTAGVTLSLTMASLSAGSSNVYSSEMVHLLLLGIIGSVVVTQFLMSKPQRVRVVVCGGLIAVLNLVVMLAVGLMTSSNISHVLGNAIWSMAGGLLSGLIAVGFQPVFEAAFNLATPSKLLELANPNQPLLRRLLIEAPGTYHHSIVVANLSEAAAEKIGANPLLARTGAYFHDIGKLKRPLYFKENQRGENPHDRTDAYVSAAIVTSHTRDGLQLAQKHHLPPEIQRIIAEHHGDTPVMYFYHKALQQADGKPVDIADFRYGGHPPATKESAIVMLADTIEAAVRSMADPTPQAIRRFIERLVRGKLEDGQLSNSPLTLKDIDGVCEAFSSVLSGVFHERIEYPTVHIPSRGEAPVQQPAQTKPAKSQEPVKKEEPVQPMVADDSPEPFNAPMPDGEMPKAEEEPASQPVDGEDNA